LQARSRGYSKVSMDISVIIVTYNSGVFVKNCIESILSNNNIYKKEIILVDNGSVDSTIRIAASFKSAIRIIKNVKNLGYAAGNNIGIRCSKGKNVLILNPDIVLGHDFIANILEFLESDQHIGIIGPKLLYPDNRIQESCRKFYSIRTIIMRRTIFGKLFPQSKYLKEHLMSDWDRNSVRDVDWVLGACMLMRRASIEKLGYFDEGYRLYFEDVDLCYRMHKSGLRVVYNPNIICIHHHQRESAKRFNKQTYWHIQSGIRFFRKHGWRM